MGAVTFDQRQWKRAIRFYQEESKKGEAETLNHAGSNLAYRAAQFTPVTSNASIRASLTGDQHLLAALTSIHLRHSGVGILKSPAFKEAMAALVKSRQGAKKYLRASWAPIVRAFNKKFRGGVNAKTESAYAKQTGIESSARPASPSHLVALMKWVNKQPNSHKAEGAEKIAEKALSQAFTFVIRDLLAYRPKQHGKIARKYSAK